MTATKTQLTAAQRVLRAKVYELISEDLTGLGAPMGMERVTTNFRRHFATAKAAKAAAEKDYNGSRGTIVWSRKYGGWQTQDLGYVMYRIRPLKVEG